MVFSENLHTQLSVIPLLGEDGSSGVRALVFFSSRIRSSRGESSSTCATSKTKATIFNNNIMKSQQTQTQWINQLLNTSVKVLTLACPIAAASCFFIYIRNEILQCYSPGSLAVYCTTSQWRLIKMNLLWMKILPFFFLYKSFFKGSNPTTVFTVRDTLQTADLSGSLPTGISLLSYLSPVWTHHYLWVLLAAPKASWPVTSSAHEHCHTASGSPFCSGEKHS